jgi:hypothetical protein
MVRADRSELPVLCWGAPRATRPQSIMMKVVRLVEIHR